VNSVITWNPRIIFFFFSYPLARYVWNVVGVALNLDVMPCSFSKLYRQCFASFSGIDKKSGNDRGCCSMLDTLEDTE
jgi:hypothetical protein